MNNDRSASEYIIDLLDTDKRVIKIGLNTNGTHRMCGDKRILLDNKHNISIMLLNGYDFYTNNEGIGYLPDIWANNILDVFINLWTLTGDYELKIDLGARGNVEYSNYSKYSSMLIFPH